MEGYIDGRKLTAEDREGIAQCRQDWIGAKVVGVPNRETEGRKGKIKKIDRYLTLTIRWKGDTHNDEGYELEEFFIKPKGAV